MNLIQRDQLTPSGLDQQFGAAEATIVGIVERFPAAAVVVESSCCPCLPHLPPGSLSAMRFVTAVQEQEKGGDKLVEQVSRELWRRIWSEDKDITEAASLAEVPAGPAWFCLERLISDALLFVCPGSQEGGIV